MNYTISNPDHDEMVSLILQELNKVLKDKEGIESILPEKVFEKEKKCEIIGQLCFTLVTGVAINFIYDTLKGICMKYRNSPEFNKKTRISIREGDKVITIDMEEVMKK